MHKFHRSCWRPATRWSQRASVLSACVLPLASVTRPRHRMEALRQRTAHRRNASRLRRRPLGHARLEDKRASLGRVEAPIRSLRVVGRTTADVEGLIRLLNRTKKFLSYAFKVLRSEITGEKDLKRYLLAGVVAAFLASTAYADCRSASSNYNSALDDVATTLKRYTRCVADSKGQDDCSSEFRRLKSAQNDFESAVASLRYECR
jgi:hypothetical protein